MAQRTIVIDDITGKEIEEKDAFIRAYPVRVNGTRRVLDLLQTTIDDIHAGKINLGDVLAKGTPYPRPRWSKDTELAQEIQDWHYKVKLWAVDLDPITGNYNCAPKSGGNNNVPSSLAGVAPRWLVEYYLELHPEDPMPEAPVPPKTPAGK